jgi:oligopeptide transport system substrate-binding protein
MTYRVTILSGGWWQRTKGIWSYIGFIILFAAIHGCDAKSGHSTQNRPPTSTAYLRRGIGGEPASLDPGQADDVFSYEVIRDLYEGLETESAAGTVEPGVALSWSVDSTGTRYTFQLRHDAKWSNGTNVRAQDFVSAWRRVVDPKRGSPVADLLRPVAHASEIIAGRLSPVLLGVSAIQEDLLVVQLEQPAPYFPQLLTHSATFPIYSEDAAATHNSRNWVSNGPYVLSSWTPGANLKLTKNPQYWDRDGTRIMTVEYISIADENSELNQYRAGQLDVTQSVPSSALPLVRKEIPNELLVAPFLGTAYYALNLHSAKFPANPKLRQALAMAIDRRALEMTLLTFGQTPAYGFVPPGTWNYDPQSWQWKSLADVPRIAEARNLYNAAGFSAGNPLRLRLLFNSNPAIRKMAIAIASMWKETLGVETELVDEEYRVFLDSRKDTTRWDIARLGWTADYNDAGNFLDIFRRGSPNNDATYANEQFDSLVGRAAATSNSSDRRDLLQAAEKLMLSEYPVIPIYFYSSKRLIKPYVKGARTNPLNRLYTRHLFIEPN